MTNLGPVPASVRAPLADRYAAALVRHRGRWTALALALLAGAGVLASRLRFRADAADFLPRGTSHLLPAGLPADPTVVVMESTDPVRAIEVGPLLDTLASRLAALPGVHRVEHRLDPVALHFVEAIAPRHLLMYLPPAELDALAQRLGRPHLERALLGQGEPIPRTALATAMGVERTDPLGVVDPVLAHIRRLGGDARVRIVDGYFTVPDQRSWFVLVEPAGPLTSIAAQRRHVAAIDSVIADTRRAVPSSAPLRILAVGRSVAVVAGMDAAIRDVTRVAIAATLIVFVALMLALRRWWGPVLITGTVLAGIVVTAAIAALTIGTVNPANWAFIAALVGFGDEFALYIVSHYWLTAGAGADRAGALADAMRRPGMGVALGAATTVAAFLALGVIRYRVMTELALLSALGMGLILMATFTLLPLALAWTQPGRLRVPATPRGPPTEGSNGASRARWRRVGIGAWLVVVIASSAFAIRRLEVSLHPWALAVRGVPQSAALADLSARLGASFTPFLMLSRGATEGDALAVERRALAALDGVRAEAGVASAVALSRWIPDTAAQRASRDAIVRHAAAFSGARFARDWEQVMRARPASAPAVVEGYVERIGTFLDPDTATISLGTLRAAGLGPIVDRHLVPDSAGVLAIAQVYPTTIPWRGGVVDRFRRGLATVPADAFAGVTWASEALHGATRATALRTDVQRACALGVVLMLLVLALRFRRVAPVGLALVPASCALAVMFGVMALLGVELNLITLVALPIVAGLGSDDGIHIIDRLARGEQLAIVLRETGIPMRITTFTTIGGFAALMLARFPDVALAGAMAALGLVVALAASLHLLPLLVTEFPAWHRPMPTGATKETAG